MPNNEAKREVEVLNDTEDGAVDVDAAGDDEVIVPTGDEAEVKEAIGKASASGADDSVNNNNSASGTTSKDNAGGDKGATKEGDVRSQHKLEGETDREYALRQELLRVKNKQRKESTAAIAGMAKPPVSSAQSDERMKKLQERYSPEEIKNMEEAIDVIAASRGYVKREENYQDTVNGVLNGFIEAHKEYTPEHDKDDIRWGRFEEILLSDYNLQGKTPKQLEAIFNKVHRDVASEMGEVTIPDKSKTINAQKQKIQSVSHSGGNSGQNNQPTGKKVNLDPEVRKRLKGFDDEDFL